MPSCTESIDDQQVSRIDLHADSLTTPDGIVLTDDGVLYVVEHEADAIAKLQLSETYDGGQLLSRTTSPSIRCPTTAAIAGDRLLVVNSQFCDPSISRSRCQASPSRDCTLQGLNSSRGCRCPRSAALDEAAA